MGFEPDQPRSHVESVNKFKDWMKDTLREVKVALAKSKDDMMLYYNQKWTLALEFMWAIWSSLMLATSRPLDHHGSFLTGNWDHFQLTHRLVTVCTASASLP